MENLLTNHPDYKRLRNLIVYLASNEGEEDWFDFKMNNGDPDQIGEYISALSNSATLCNHGNGYLIWGVEDKSHELLGTSFNPAMAKKGGEELENYLSHMTTPSLAIAFYRLQIEENYFVVLQVPKAKSQPTKFAGKAYVRIGSNSHPLSKYPEKEMKLWSAMASSVYETEPCKEELEPDEALGYLEFSAYYTRRKLPVPTSREEIISTFLQERFFSYCDSKKIAITNLGALLFAKDLYDFPALNSKAIRVIRYEGKSRVNALSEVEFHQGYAVDFEEIIRYVGGYQTQREEISLTRETRNGFAPVVLREIVANIMVHQDLLDRTFNPMVEIFDGSIDATNPGVLLVDVSRLIDAAPVCRNEVLARSMRLLRLIEDRGSGFDRIEEALSQNHNPSPSVRSEGNATRITLLSKDTFANFTEAEALNTLYTYCCYGYVNLDVPMNNAFFRNRFGVPEKDAAVISRLLAKAVETNRIKLSSDSTGMRNRTYLPFWA